MYNYSIYQTPSRRQRGLGGPPLKVEVITAQDQGLMTPLSAASCVSNLQDNWNGAPPVHGLVDPNVLNIGPTDMMHIDIKADAFDHNGIPTPDSYSSGYFEAGHVLDSDQASSPLNQPSMEIHGGMNWQTRLRDSHFPMRFQSANSSYDLPAFQGLSLESPSTSFSSSYSEAQSSMYSSCSSASSNCCVGPLQTLANPMQDCSQFMPQEWQQGGSSPIVDQDYNDYAYGSPTQLPSPVSQGPFQSIKMDPHLGSASPFQVSSKPRRRPSQISGTKNKTSFKKRGSKSTETYVHHEVTKEGNVVDLLVGREASGSFKCDEPKCGKIFKRCEHYKRHLKTHTGEKTFRCFYCPKLFGRGDNANQHHWTHVNRWMYQDEAKVRIANARQCNIAELGRDRCRNTVIGPNAARATVYDRCGGKDSEESAKHLEYLQRSAGNIHGVHFDWEAEDVEARLLKCYGAEQCAICCAMCPPARDTTDRPAARTAAR